MRYAHVTALSALFAAAFAACVTDEPPVEQPPPEVSAETATAAFALTQQCAQCAATATQNVCGPAAQACLQDPNCANVSGCVQACPQNDPMCIAACFQAASQVMNDLADCVVCQECPVECAGLWQCSMAPGGNGGTGGTGGAAGGAGGSGGASPGGQCDNMGDCQACVFCSIQGPCQPQQLQDPTAVFTCAVCDECPNDCANAPQLPGAPTCPP